MKTFSRTTIAISLLTLLHCTGCSWIFMRRAPDEYKNQTSIDCSGKALPTADLIIAAASLAQAVLWLFVALSPGSNECAPDDGELICFTARDFATFFVPFSALTALIHGLSAWSGYCWAEECRNVKNKHNLWRHSLPPVKRVDLERRIKEERCERLESIYKMSPSSDNLKQYISECGDLIRARADKPDRFGLTELHRVCRDPDWRRARFLLRAGANVNARDKYGWTPLHYAASLGHEKIVKMLLKRGADPLAKNNENQTPIHLAHDKDHPDIVKTLRSYARKRKLKGGEKP